MAKRRKGGRCQSGKKKCNRRAGRWEQPRCIKAPCPPIWVGEKKTKKGKGRRGGKVNVKDIPIIGKFAKIHEENKRWDKYWKSKKKKRGGKELGPPPPGYMIAPAGGFIKIPKGPKLGTPIWKTRRGGGFSGTGVGHAFLASKPWAIQALGTGG